MKMKTILPAKEHREFHDELTALLKKHADRLSSQEVLALTAQIVGKCIAMQDRFTTTHEMVWKIVADNIELGNAQVVADLMNATGTKK